jgi:hypothetical protein
MALKPSKDYLTSRHPLPQFRSDNGSHLAFALVCSPTTYGVPLYEEMLAKNQAHEYISVRNAAILRRECLRLDFLNPVVADRIEYLKELKRSVAYFSHSFSATRIARGIVQLLLKQMDTYQNQLVQRSLLIDSISEYQDQFGKRLSYLLAFMTTDDESHKLLSTYESLLRDIALILSGRPQLLKYLLLNNGFYSYIVVLTDNEKETRFFPLLTARERALIKAHLTDLGESDHEGILSSEDDAVIRPMWPSLITISKHGNGDFFRSNSTHEFDTFGYVQNAETKSVTEIQAVNVGNRGPLLELLHPQAQIPLISSNGTDVPNRINTTHNPTTPPSATPTTWTSPHSKVHFTESSMLMASSQSEALGQIDHGRPRTTSPKPSSDAASPITPTWHGENATNKVKRISFSDQNCDLTIIRASASMSPERQSLGNVAHVSFLTTTANGQVSIDFFFKRFDFKPDGSIDLYLTKQGKFNEILNLRNKLVSIRIDITQGGTKESKELTQEASLSWFATSME